MKVLTDRVSANSFMEYHENRQTEEFQFGFSDFDR